MTQRRQNRAAVLFGLAKAATAWALLAFAPAGAVMAETAEIDIAVLRLDRGPELPVSRLDKPPADLGFAGARLGNDDNQTTGRFLGQTFTLTEVDAEPETALDALEGLIAEDIRFIVVLADAANTLALADAAGDRALVLNAHAPDDSLRREECRANLIHVAPSRAMRTDALAQFLVWKKWREWFLIEGSHPADQALAAAWKRTASKFGAEIVEERIFEDTGGARNTDSGHVQVRAQIPVFTQRAEEHDVVVAADETDVFAAYLPFHTWDARPVVGSAGLRPVVWHPAMEAWGAPQFQNRFERLTGRTMRERDYLSWLAVRVVGEAASRAGGTDFETMRAFILSDEFEVAGFKGQKLTLRPWNLQLRQPILLAADKVLVSVSPQPEFLHKSSRLDTLGADEPEVSCTLN